MSVNFCPRCGNPIKVIGGVAPNFCAICSNKLNPNDNPVQTKQVQRLPPQIKKRLDVNPGSLKRVPKPLFPPRRVRTLRTQYTPALVGTTIQPKPPVPIWAIVVPIIVVVVIVVVAFVVSHNKNNGTTGWNTNIGITQGDGSNDSNGSSGSGGSLCASQGTLSNGCDRCLLGWLTAVGNVNLQVPGAETSTTYFEDGTISSIASASGYSYSTSGTWYCSNGQLCLENPYYSSCAPYSVNGSSVSWGGFSYDTIAPSIPVP